MNVEGTTAPFRHLFYFLKDIASERHLLSPNSGDILDIASKQKACSTMVKFPKDRNLSSSLSCHLLGIHRKTYPVFRCNLEGALRLQASGV